MVARRRGLHRSVWIWTAVVEEADESWWMDFEVGSRQRQTFMRLCRRLPDVENTCFKTPVAVECAGPNSW